MVGKQEARRAGPLALPFSPSQGCGGEGRCLLSETVQGAATGAAPECLCPGVPPLSTGLLLTALSVVAIPRILLEGTFNHPQELSC